MPAEIERALEPLAFSFGIYRSWLLYFIQNSVPYAFQPISQFINQTAESLFPVIQNSTFSSCKKEACWEGSKELLVKSVPNNFRGRERWLRFSIEFIPGAKDLLS